MVTRDELFMAQALEEAKIAEKKGEVPVGAVIVLGDKVIAKAHNLRQTKRKATDHAEILAINKACKKIKDFRLNNCEIFVTLEPCLMCFGAILNARIKRLIFGAKIGHKDAITCKELNERAMLNFKTTITEGVLEDSCSKLVTEFFKDKRKNEV
ncbi:MAG: nucleoside deaminase [bacterium]|nr:nucleoside deaminase [bacterium]